MIREKKRIITDKATDVQHPISKVQELELNQRFRRGSKAIIVPTTLEYVSAVIITAKNASGAKVIKDGYYSNLTLYSASNSTVQTVLTQPTGAASYACQKHQLMLRNGQLYSALQNLTAAQYASASLVPTTDVKNDYWVKEEAFPAGLKRYLIVNTQASTATWADVAFNVTVFGY